MMATRAIPRIRSSLVNAVNQPTFSLRAPSTTTDKSQFFPTAGLLQRNLTCVSGISSVIIHPHYGSSLGNTQLSQSMCYSSAAYASVNPRFGKQRRNRGDMKGDSGNDISFGSYGLQVLEPAWITSKQILAGQLAMKRNMRGGKLVLRIFPHKPVSLKPAETRMGRGKGSVAYWVAGVRTGRILYEIKGVPENVARKAVTVAASKFPIRTQFVRS